MTAAMDMGGGFADRWSAWRDAAAARDERRGYRVHGGRLALAYAIELIVIATSLTGAWLFARQTAHGDIDIIVMMMLAPVSYAVLEFVRVPLASSIRTQTSLLMRLVAVVGVVSAAGVTVKSMSQLGELMFRPRLAEVAEARQALKQAEGLRDEIGGRIASADRDVVASEAAVKTASDHLAQAMKENASLPPRKCVQVQRRNGQGRLYTTTQCSDDPRVKVQNSALQGAEQALADARGKLDQAKAARLPLSAKSAEEAVTRAKVHLDEAVSRSQLHAFTAMAFGKDPLQVADGEIAQFLRVFVFVPAIFVSLASTMLALTAIERIRPADETVTLPDEAAHFILAPYAASIIEEAAKSAAAAQAEALSQAREEALQAVRAEATKRSRSWWGRVLRREAAMGPVASEAGPKPAAGATARAEQVGERPDVEDATPARDDMPAQDTTPAQDDRTAQDDMASVTPLRRK